MTTESVGRRRAWDSVMMQLSVRRLAHEWRQRALAVSDYDQELGEVWAEAAKELERTVDIPNHSELLERLLTGIRQEIVAELRMEVCCRDEPTGAMSDEGERGRSESESEELRQ